MAEDTKTIEQLLQKLKANREKVPAELLRTRYKQSYDQLIETIKAELTRLLKPVSFRLPEWAPRTTKPEYADAIVEIANRIYKEGGYARKIGAAATKRYSYPEALQIAQEINRKFEKELESFSYSKICLYATAECFTEEPKSPKYYNDFTGQVYNEEANRWEYLPEDKREPGILIFIKGDQQK